MKVALRGLHSETMIFWGTADEGPSCPLKLLAGIKSQNVPFSVISRNPTLRNWTRRAITTSTSIEMRAGLSPADEPKWLAARRTAQTWLRNGDEDHPNLGLQASDGLHGIACDL